MIAEEILERMRQRNPFQPFRLHLKDGRSFDILYPEIHLARIECFDLGKFLPDNPTPFPDYLQSIPYDKIARIEPLDIQLPDDINEWHYQKQAQCQPK